MSANNISDDLLSKLCDFVENTLEDIVIQFRGQFFEEGMEGKLRAQYESRLSIMIAKRGGDFEVLPPEQQKFIQNRIETALDLFKKEYES